MAPSDKIEKWREMQCCCHTAAGLKKWREIPRHNNRWGTDTRGGKTAPCPLLDSCETSIEGRRRRKVFNYAVDLNFLLDTLQQMQENGQKKKLCKADLSQKFCPVMFSVQESLWFTVENPEKKE